MTPAQVLETYDESYAREYNSKYLLRADGHPFEKTTFELNLTRTLTKSASSWLDVACGTGFFLQHGRGNKNLACAGLDLSPAMLAEARQSNPDALFINADFRKHQPTLLDRWDVTTCLWGAYALQECFSDIESLVRNLALWTRRGGICLMPVFDPKKLLARRDSNEPCSTMSVSDDGTVWSFWESCGKLHDRLLSPPVSDMERLFSEHFTSVQRYSYPPDADGSGLVGLLARK